jgi:lipopolysaccharide export system permease protein
VPDSVNPQLPLPIASAAFNRARNSAEARGRALNRAERIRGIITRETAAIANQTRLINQYRIEIHKKYSIPAACIVFVLIGSPLGVRSRRGGLGVGMGVSLGLFLVYWAFLIGGEDLADRGIVSPFSAMWAADILIGGVGLILLWSVTNEVSLSPRALWHRLTERTKPRSTPRLTPETIS